MKVRYLIGAALGLMVLTGCGKWAKAQKQAVVTVDAPKFPGISDNVFSLTNGIKKTVSYKSTMLILNPTGEVDLLADLIKNSEITRIKAAEARVFVGNEKDFDDRYGDSGTVVQEIKVKQEALKVFLTDAQTRAIPIPLLERQKAASTWVEKEKSGLSLNAEDLQHFDTTWADYCDAKIVELAVHPLFAKLSVDGYSERPSPFQFCENYYSARSYFKSDACTRGEYFQCIWTDGVMKSGNLLSQSGQTLATLLGPILADNDQTEIFRKILQSDTEISAPYINISSLSAISQAKAKAAIYDKKNYLSGWMLSGTGSFGTDATCTKILDPAFNFICGMFSRTWKDKNPQNYLSAVEFFSSLIVNKDVAGLQIISDVAKYFGQRPLIGTPQNSNSDLLFHAVKTPGVLVQPTASSLGVTQDAVTTINNIFLDTLFSLNPEDKTIKGNRESVLVALQKELDFHREERNRLTNVAADSLRTAIRSANGGSIGLGFIAYRMTVTNENRLMRASMSFEGFYDLAFEGCYDKELLASIDCPSSPDGSVRTSRKAKLNVNPSKGRIEFSFLVDQPDSFGMGLKPKSTSLPDYFMNITPAAIQNTTLRFELYPNRLNKALDILTGKALFNRDGLDVYEAGISMWEE